MVERPIKKSERLAKAESAEATGASSLPSSEERRETRPARGRDKGGKGKGGKGKGKGRGEDEKPQAINPALMRGPKPAKPQPPKEEVAPEVTEETSETIAEETTPEEVTA
ncbi:hypothetical protein [Pantanalinema sp. GBBB05]|uniref:hypothetical protein n=1 Tax=Pantanalinema sp. GBBB05 TaxID=2604139 RepID=UPI001DE06E13|nr:hypothetical protein [Pantanalinema sp. GBBB05]